MSAHSLIEDQRQILDHLYDGLYVVDRERTIVYWNPAATRITGFQPAEVVGSRCYDNVLNHVDGQGCGLCQGGCPLVATMGDGEFREALVYLRHRAGHRVPVEVRASPLRDREGQIVGAIEVFQDGHARENMRCRVDELARLAEVDPLTQVANRRAFDRQLSSRLEDLAPGRGSLSVLFLDLDRFKNINDTWGHQAGDRVLQEVASTLAAAVREGDLVARIGGEEFAVLMRIDSPERLSGLGERLLALVRATHPLLEGGRRISVTVSVGGAVAGAGESSSALLARADRALYTSKRGGRNRFTLDRGEVTDQVLRFAPPRAAVNPPRRRARR